ncbi:MAG: MarR family winged helix-turn-helix transcriptional regulator [Desulfovibrio sp.]|jgi:DNA-binding MarR family transcriptional regulator|nr:MarR family winged helix-turn-helix transcriptional regulator [Desulfovibrio sp.]
MPRQEISMRNDASASGENTFQCPLCEKHCPLDDPGCRKGIAFAKKTTCFAQRGLKMTNENGVIFENSATGEALTRLFRRALKAISRAHHSRGHTRHAQGHVLAVLKEKETMNRRDLMDGLNVRSASMSEILAKLERNGFIIRERSDQDKRNFIISITEQGRAMAEKHMKEHLENAEAVFAPLSDAERRQLGKLLKKIITPLEKDDAGHDAAHEHGFGHRHGHGRHRRDEEHGDHGEETFPSPISGESRMPESTEIKKIRSDRGGLWPDNPLDKQ